MDKCVAEFFFGPALLPIYIYDLFVTAMMMDSSQEQRN